MKGVFPADYHIHTQLCGHATGQVRDYLECAVRKGLKEIGFSEHAPMPIDGFDDWHIRQGDLEFYAQVVQVARGDFPDLEVRIGLEVDYIPGLEPWIEQIASRYRWDYIIGSVHYVGEWDIDNEAKMSRWDHVEVNDLWIRYVELLIKAAASGLFDIIGHIDLAKKFGHRPDIDLVGLYRPFLQLVGERGLAIELSTGGLRKPCRETYPSEPLLRLAADYQVRLVFGSDAHAPEEVGYEFEKAVKMARIAGFQCWTRFTERRPHSVVLPEVGC